jgi:hypothetical protein
MVVLWPALVGAQVVTVTAQLYGGEEIPVPSAPTGAHGNAVVTVDRAAQRITYRVNVYNLPTGITASHIHVGPVGQAGPIIFNFNVTATVSNDFSYSGEVTAADLLVRAPNGIGSFDDAAMAIASGLTYVNVHSQANPGGEIRGQLCPESPASNTYNGIAVCLAKK